MVTSMPHNSETAGASKLPYLLTMILPMASTHLNPALPNTTGWICLRVGGKLHPIGFGLTDKRKR